MAAAVFPLAAKSIDVSANSQVVLGHDDSLIFSISPETGCSYPVEIEILLGGMPLGASTASIPGTSGVYFTGELLRGAIESRDGSVSIPFNDPNASRLGLPAGDMLLVPGSRTGGSYSGDVELLSATVTLSSQEAADLFALGGAVVDLQNIGADATFGYPGSRIANDFSASLFDRNRSRSTAAQVLRVECVHTPEPGTTGLLLIGLAIIFARICTHCRNRWAAVTIKRNAP